MGVRRWGQRLRRSLRMRLVLLFLLLALATTAIFLAGMQRALSGGWSGVSAHHHSLVQHQVS